MFNAKVFKFASLFGDCDVFFCLNTYLFGGGIALQVIKYPSAEPLGFITVNLSFYPLQSPLVFLDVKNFPGILEFMCDNDFSSGALSYVHSGYVDYPLVRLNLSRIREYSISA